MLSQKNKMHFHYMALSEERQHRVRRCYRFCKNRNKKKFPTLIKTSKSTKKTATWGVKEWELERWFDWFKRPCFCLFVYVLMCVYVWCVCHVYFAQGSVGLYVCVKIRCLLCQSWFTEGCSVWVYVLKPLQWEHIYRRFAILKFFFFLKADLWLSFMLCV